MTNLPDLDLMSPASREFYELGRQPEDPFKYDKRQWHAKYGVEALAKAIRTTKWYRGRIKAGHGAHEDGACYVSWLNACPLTVVEKPAERRKYREEGQPIYGYSFHFSVGGHFSGSSDTLAGAVQEAMVGAVRVGGRRDSDSSWLNAKGGQKGFFEYHEVDIASDSAMKLADFMVPEFLASVPVTEGPYADGAEPPRP